MTEKKVDNSEKYTEILRAALEVISEKGWERATISEIAAKANVGKGTVYLYFKSKDEIFETIISAGIQDTHKLFLDFNLEDDPIVQLRSMLHAFFESLTQHHKLFTVILSTFPGFSFNTEVRKTMQKSAKDIQTILTDFFQYFMDIGVFKKSDPHIPACIFFEFFAHLPISWVLSGTEKNLNEIVDPLLDLFFDGIKQ